ncbi:MAG: hypothetical protein IJS60_08860 [Abditibacteriota bacterium]|nr:hypothetical protein [Abditibacteriota bacterium]
METYGLEKEFKALMTKKCSVYRKDYGKRNDGTRQYTDKLIENNICHYHSTSINLLQLANKESIHSAYIFCLPLDSLAEIDDVIECDGMKFNIKGTRNATTRFEKIFECELNE